MSKFIFRKLKNKILSISFYRRNHRNRQQINGYRGNNN